VQYLKEKNHIVLKKKKKTLHFNFDSAEFFFLSSVINNLILMRRFNLVYTLDNCNKFFEKR